MTASSMDRNKRLLGLAMECRFLYPRKKEKLVALLEERSEPEVPADVTDLFREEKVMSDENITYLLALDDHLQALEKDLAFGRLAVANHLVDQAHVDAALDYQKARFKADHTHTKLGDILVEGKQLSTADRAAILLTQNRIRNEALLEAIQSLGNTPAQEDMINKRFGVIAIKKGMVTTDQVKAALAVQKKGEDQRFIGQILQDTAGLGEEDLQAVLLEQRMIEVRRLDFEKALYTVKSELKICKKLTAYFRSTLSEDGSQAFVEKKAVPDDPVPVYELIIWLRKTGICFGIFNDDALSAFLNEAEPGKPVLLAQGIPPVPGKDEALELLFDQGQAAHPAAEATNSEETDPPLLPPATRVHKGEAIARLHPATEGRPGKDVLGHQIHPGKPSCATVYPGKGVTRQGNDFIAAISGIPRFTDNTLSITPETVATNHTTLTGNIEADTEDQHREAAVTLKGSILAQGLITCHTMTCAKDLLGKLICQKDAVIQGNVGQKQTGAAPPDSEQPPAELISHGQVTLLGDVCNARISCAGPFSAMNGTARGAFISSAFDIRLRDVTASGNRPSILWAGIPPDAPQLSIDRTLEQRQETLGQMKMEQAFTELRQTYETEKAEAETRIMQQTVYRSLAQIIEAPELYQYPELADKLEYLYSLPEFSSIRNYYLTIPDTLAAKDFLEKQLASWEKASCSDILKRLQNKIEAPPEAAASDDPESEAPQEQEMGELERIELGYTSRRDALEQEVEEKQEEIGQLEAEIRTLETALEKLAAAGAKQIRAAGPVIRIKNRCEKGTIVRGKASAYQVQETIYNVKFREILDPRSRQPMMVIED